MKRLFGFMITAVLAFSLAGCGGFVDTGEVGIKTSQGQIDPNVLKAGYYSNLFSSVDMYTIKETAVEFNDLTPRAKDNLSLKDLEVTVYYKTDPDQLAVWVSTHSGQSAQVKGESYIRPGYNKIYTTASGIINDSVAKFDSLTLHQNRTPLEADIKTDLQKALNADSSGLFTITNVVIRAIHTDPSIEDSIRKAIMAEKEVQTATQLVLVKQQEAKANEMVAQSLTPEYLQHEYNQALLACAQNQHCTMIVGSNVQPQLNIK